jgi:ubiquinone/menaquinone biosynthesis C-methylase UbiE
VFLEKLLSHIGDTSTAKVLELGCGAGIPATRLLADHFQHVVANDISDAQIDLARTNVPQANVTFVREDMTQLTFEDESLSAVVAFYSIIHLPREEQPAMLQQIWAWLTPGGILLCNLGVSDDPGTMNEDWLGARMYWSSFNAAANIEQVKKAGFAIVESEVLSINEDGDMVPFLWILAKKGCLEPAQG